MMFSNKEQEGIETKAEDFSKKSLENYRFSNYSIYNCNFSESLLRNAHFCSCTFSGCNLSLVKLDGCRIQDVQFLDCKIVGAEFFKCEKMFFSAHFKNCLISYCNFSDLNMKGTSFLGSRLKESHFTSIPFTAESLSSELIGLAAISIIFCLAFFCGVLSAVGPRVVHGGEDEVVRSTK